MSRATSSTQSSSSFSRPRAVTCWSGRTALSLLLTLASVPASFGCTRSTEPPKETKDVVSDVSREGGRGTRAKGEEGALVGARPAEPRYAEPLAEKAAAPTSPAPTGLGLSGLGQGGGGIAQGFGSGHGRLGGAHKSSAPRYALRSDAGETNTESYAHVAEGSFFDVKSAPLSTFSVDVDTASYSNARRFLNDGQLPPVDAIRVEEWINYFDYDYPEPSGDRPFSVSSEVTSAPWNPNHRLVRIGLRGIPMADAEVPPRNLVFLLDVSGSMASPDKLPLVKKGLSLLVEQLRPTDTISIVVYAGASGLVLPPTAGHERAKISAALEALDAGGSTNGGEGIRLAYASAERALKRGGINRVILATDGDFNVGTTSEGELQRLVEEKRKTGVFLTVLGFGTGNVKDSTMEMLADKGNGNYAYVDSELEAKKVLVREAGATLVTIAKDVKIQVEFNPRLVASYRLIGYENRALAARDFNDDRKDAGEIGAGHDVTALYEVVPHGAPNPSGSVDPLKYRTPGLDAPAAAESELLTVKLRYKKPAEDVSTKFEVVVADRRTPLAEASLDTRFAAAVAEAALVLRGSDSVKGRSLEDARAAALAALGADRYGERREFLALLDAATRLGAR